MFYDKTHAIEFIDSIDNYSSEYKSDGEGLSWPEQYRHSWYSWHLVPSSRPTIVVPPVKTNYISVPGANGKLDLTTSLTGYPLYDNRVNSLEFWVMNGYHDWASLYSELLAYFHGQNRIMILEDDPGYYYEGRFAVNEWKSDSERSIVTLDYDLKPFKYQIIEDLYQDNYFYVGGSYPNSNSIALDLKVLTYLSITANIPSDHNLSLHMKNGNRITMYTLTNGLNVFEEPVYNPNNLFFILSNQTHGAVVTNTCRVDYMFAGGIL